MNKAIITGRLTFNPELKTTQNGVSFCKIQIAAEGNSSKDETNFIDCIAWREKAEFISRWFRKGSAIEIEGEIRTIKYESEGRIGKTVQVKIDLVKFALTNKNDTGAGSLTPADYSDYEEIIDDEEDLPF